MSSSPMTGGKKNSKILKGSTNEDTQSISSDNMKFLEGGKKKYSKIVPKRRGGGPTPAEGTAAAYLAWTTLGTAARGRQRIDDMLLAGGEGARAVAFALDVLVEVRQALETAEDRVRAVAERFAEGDSGAIKDTEMSGDPQTNGGKKKKSTKHRTYKGGAEQLNSLMA